MSEQVSIEEKEILEALLKEVRESAQKEAEKILKEAEEKAKEILKETEARAEEELRKKIERIKKRVRSEVSSKIALEKMKIRREYLMEKERIIEDLLSEVSEKIRRLIEKDSEKYKLCLLNLIIEAALHMQNEKLFVVTTKRDTKLVEEILPEAEKLLLKKYSRKVRLRLAEEKIEALGGVVLRDKNSKEIYNNTIEARINRVKTEVLPKILSEIAK